jgi:acetyl esterase/lipase
VYLGGVLNEGPSVFGADAVSRETVAFVEELTKLMGSLPRPSDFESAVEFREFWTSDDGPFGPLVRVDWAEERMIPGPDAKEIRLRSFRRGDSPAVLLYMFAGGFVRGAEDRNDLRHERFLDATGVAVVANNYRLAPEHKWPAAIDDCEAAALWLVEHAAAEYGTSRIMIGGESSGAYLAVLTMLRLRDHHGFSDWAGAILINGLYDLRPTFSKTKGNTDPVIDIESLDYFINHYIGGTPAENDLDNPGVSPVIADLRELGPAHFTIGTRDALLDENLTMAARWQAAGNSTELQIYPGVPHAFSNFPIPIADQAIDNIHNWTKKQLSPKRT